jgi:tetratricopeptide (TPR) repeat protein
LEAISWFTGKRGQVPSWCRRGVIDQIVRADGGFKHFAFVLLSAVFISSVAPSTPQQAGPSRASEQADRLFQQAQADIAKSDYDAAAGKYRDVLALEPHSPQALSNLGVCLYFAGQTQSAVEPLQKALRIDPDQLPANLILGMAYVKLGEHQKALTPLQRALLKDSKNRDALRALASAFFGLHQYDKAVEAYAKELKLYASDSEGWYGAGVSSEQLAESAVRRLAELDRNSSYSHRLVGEYLTENDTGIEAEEALQQALAASRGEGEGLHAALGFVLLRLDEPSKAFDEFQSEVHRFPGNLDGKLGLAAVEIRQRHVAEGLSQLCGIFQTDAGYLHSHISFLVTFLGQDIASETASDPKDGLTPPDCQDVATLLQSELNSPGSTFDVTGAFSPLERALVPSTAEGLTTARATHESEIGHYDQCARSLQEVPLSRTEDELRLARCACLSGRFLVSLEAARNVLNENPGNTEGYYWQAESAKSLAKMAFQRATSLSPNSWQSQLLLGDIYRQRRDWNAATSHYNAAVQLHGGSAAAHLGLATVFWENGSFDRARQSLDEVLRLDPQNAQANLELGDIQVRAHRFQEALPFLQKSLAEDPDHSLLVHADLGKSYAELGQVEKAIAELSAASSMDRSGEIHYQLYRLYQQQGKATLAREALAESERLREQEAKDVQRHLLRGNQSEEDSRIPR